MDRRTQAGDCGPIFVGILDHQRESLLFEANGGCGKFANARDEVSGLDSSNASFDELNIGLSETIVTVPFGESLEDIDKVQFGIRRAGVNKLAELAAKNTYFGKRTGDAFNPEAFKCEGDGSIPDGIMRFVHPLFNCGRIRRVGHLRSNDFDCANPPRFQNSVAV